MRFNRFAPMFGAFDRALNHQGSRLRGVLALVVLLVFCPAHEAVAQQAWSRLYSQAEEHIRKHEWTAAEADLIEAKRSGPEQGRRVLFSGMDRRLYAPDFLLGIVYLNNGKPAEALVLFQAVAKANLIVKGDRDYASLEANMRQAELAKAQLKPAVPANAIASAAPNESVPRPAPAQGSSDPVVDNPLVTVASNNVPSTSATAPARGGTPPAPVSTSPQGAPPVSPRGPSVDELNQLRSDVSAAIRKANFDGAQRTIQAFATAWPNHPAIAQLTLSVRDGQLQQRVATEKRAASEYFRGSYASVLELLARLGPSDVSPRGHFYKACSLAALWLLGPPEDKSKLDDARREFRLAAASRGEFDADRRFISPRILEALNTR